jgi:hypothetical protein
VSGDIPATSTVIATLRGVSLLLPTLIVGRWPERLAMTTVAEELTFTNPVVSSGLIDDNPVITSWPRIATEGLTTACPWWAIVMPLTVRGTVVYERTVTPALTVGKSLALVRVFPVTVGR